MRKIAKRILPFGDGLIYVLFIFVVCMSSSCSSPDKNKEGLFSQITFRDISMQGELRTRILRNFDRLESINPIMYSSQKRPPEVGRETQRGVPYWV